MTNHPITVAEISGPKALQRRYVFRKKVTADACLRSLGRSLQNFGATTAKVQPSFEIIFEPGMIRSGLEALYDGFCNAPESV